MAKTVYLKADTRRRIQKMMDAVTNDPRKYNQQSYPGQCGTPFCAAGFAVLANNRKRFLELMKDPYAVNWDYEAKKALKMPEDAHTNAVFLTVGMWPEKYRAMYSSAWDRKTPKARAARRLKAFLGFWKSILENDGAGTLHSNSIQH
jgi:hypothetical protein